MTTTMPETQTPSTFLDYRTGNSPADVTLQGSVTASLWPVPHNALATMGGDRNATTRVFVIESSHERFRDALDSAPGAVGSSLHLDAGGTVNFQILDGARPAHPSFNAGVEDVRTRLWHHNGTWFIGTQVNPPIRPGRYYQLLSSRNVYKVTAADVTSNVYRLTNPADCIAANSFDPEVFSTYGVSQEALTTSGDYIEVGLPGVGPTSDRGTEATGDAGDDTVAPPPEVFPLGDNDPDGVVSRYGKQNADGKVPVVRFQDAEMGRFYGLVDFTRPRSINYVMPVKPPRPTDNTSSFYYREMLYFSGGEVRANMWGGVDNIRVNYLSAYRLIEVEPDGTEVSRPREYVHELDVSEHLLRTELATEIDQFTQFNKMLNEVAEEESWCSEYEEVIRKLGMDGRRNAEFSVEVTLTGTFTLPSPSSYFDRQVEGALEVARVSLDSVEMQGSVTIGFNIDDTSEDAIREMSLSDLLEHYSGDLDFDEDNLDYTIESIEEV